MIRFLVFGALEIRDDTGAEVTSVLAASKHTALLAYLAIANGGSHRRDKLASMLWPDLDDERARNALSKALHHIRRTLGDAIITARGNQSVTIGPDALWCDATAFDAALSRGHLEEALDLYSRGELMEGFTLGDSNGFDSWLESARSRFRERAVRAANTLGERAEQTGNQRDSVRWAKVACSVNPYDEKALRGYIDKLITSGDRPRALETYRVFAARLAHDLEMQPSAETRALAESLRADLSSPVTKAAAYIAEPVAVPELDVEPAVKRLTWKRGALIGAVAAAVIVAAMMLLVRKPAEDSRVVAVGLLQNQTGNTALDPLADMATGEIVRDLTQAGQSVIDLRGEGSKSQNENRSRALSSGAGKVVQGDIYKRDDSLVVQMKIVDSKSGKVLHHLEPMAVPVTNAHTILDRLRAGVTGAVAALADTLYLPWTTAHSRPPNYAAFQEFMQGLDAIVNTGVRPAVDHLKKAIALDTGFVEAKIWLLEQADIIPEEKHLVDSIKKVAIAQRPMLAPFDQVALDRELAFLDGNLEKTYSASRRLVAMAPNTPDAQVYLAQAAMATRRYDEAVTVLHRVDRTKGWLKDLFQITSWDLQAHRLKGDLDGALQEWRHARSGKPTDFQTCNAGVLILSTMGREGQLDSLISECSQLPGSPPNSDNAWFLAGRGFRAGGHTDAARRAFERSLAFRQKAAAADPKRRRPLAAIQSELGMWKDAYENLRAVADTSSESDWTTLGVIAAHLGDTAVARQSLRRLEMWDRKENTRGVAKMSRAFILAAMNQPNQAIDLLREARLQGSAPAWTAWYVRFELQPLRGNPRYEELVRPET